MVLLQGRVKERKGYWCVSNISSYQAKSFRPAFNQPLKEIPMKDNLFEGYGVIKRDGTVVDFEPGKISLAIQKAYLDEFKGEAGAKMKEIVAGATERVVTALMRDKSRVHFPIEDVQDQVELALMRMGEHQLARGYILFRAKRAEARANENPALVKAKKILVDGQLQALDARVIESSLKALAVGLDVDVRIIAQSVEKELFDGASEADLAKAIRMTARTLIERDPDFDLLVARLIVSDVYREVLGYPVAPADYREEAIQAFPRLIKTGVDAGIFSNELQRFDLKRLAEAMDFSRDGQFSSSGIQTLYDRYFVHKGGTRIEVPQTFFMRVAMGLSLKEIDRNERAIEFYNVLSTFDFMNSTPTLFNSGLVRSQLASCYLTTIDDDLDAIYDGIKENALLQKFAGGLGNDWTRVRALGAHIKGTNGESQGVIPFLKVVNDTAVAVNQGGKRKGAVCAYLETWHMDIEEFLDLRKNTGDDRRRTHDMNTANWIPDLFMKRVMEKGTWTLFSPNDVPELHDLYGKAFESKYVEYEAAARAGTIKLSREVRAVDLWRKMLTMLFETGHPWITFKDPCNIRSPQQHVGVVHSSNLCTEITLNTSNEETAVCNIGSVNLLKHIKDGQLDMEKLEATVKVAMRMLDNVIDLNYYSVEKARKSNLKHRPVGIGMMGFHDALQDLGIAYASQEAVEFADTTTEALCYFAFDASSDLALERGRYSSFDGSLWSKGILPMDSLATLEAERGGYLEVDRGTKLGRTRWDALRSKIQVQGMRNSNCVAIAPTATIGNIVGVSASIDPLMGNLFVKSNLSGEFTELNASLVKKLKALGLWDAAMLADLKYFDGSLQQIERVPADLKLVYATAFEIEPQWLIQAASRRQKWIDQAQSLNIYMAGASGKKLDDTYKLAWISGLKTTYYLRTKSASSAEKSTARIGNLNAVKAHESSPVAMPELVGQACMLRPGDPGFETCESCQ